MMHKYIHKNIFIYNPNYGRSPKTSIFKKYILQRILNNKLFNIPYSLCCLHILISIKKWVKFNINETNNIRYVLLIYAFPLLRWVITLQSKNNSCKCFLINFT